MLERVYGVELIFPPKNLGNLIDDLIAEFVALAKPVDRAEELLLFESPQIALEAADFLERRKIESQRVELLMLTPAGLENFREYALFGDYAIVARSGIVYFDLDLVAAFAISKTKPDAETAPALLQLEEHLIGSLTTADGSLHLIDRQLASLADRVARAYGCAVAWEY